jgi:gamma-glutamyltranspeptidase/glutathione hydrolase
MKPNTCFSWLLVAVCGLTVTAAQALDARAAPEAASARQSQSLWQGQAPVVATANPLATAAGATTLRAGGCAVDAAIAAQAVLGLVEPQSSGLGGGAFMLHHDGQRTQSYDGRETAPMAATEDLFLQADGQPMGFWSAVVGGRAVGVPGVVRMLALAHSDHGCLPWAQLFEPAIALAEQGFAVSPRLHSLLSQDKHLRSDPAAAEYFYDPQGQAWPVGHVLRNPEYADTLRRIAQGGADAFYQGELAQAMVDKVRAHPSNPGLMRLDDLANYRPLRREPLCFEHPAQAASWRVCGMGPPSSGALAVGQIMGLMVRLGLADGGWDAARQQPTADWLHAYMDAARLAFADRALYVADPDRVAAPAGDWRSLLAPGYLDQRARLIDTAADAPSLAPASAGRPGEQVSAYAPMPAQIEYGTSHISVIDAQGHALSMTTSVESAFGARQWVRGFLLNNQLTDFSFRPRDESGRAVANRVEAGKRPRSSMSPLLVFDANSGQLIGSLGSPGGSFIIHYVSKALWATGHWGMDAQAAVDAPNWGTTGGRAVLEAERFDAATAQALQRRGPEVRLAPLTSGTQLLWRTPKGWQGGADSRREGRVMGVR